MSTPHFIEFSKTGSFTLGYITVAENKSLPFHVKRVYWTYFTPDSVIRGHHAHYELEQIIFATSGIIDFELENLEGQKLKFRLDSPNIGLYVPKLYWRTIKFSHNAVLMCLASLEYDEADYIRDYQVFKSL